MNPKLQYTIRSLEKDEEYAAFESLQHEIWGADIAEVVTAPLAKIIQRIGGVSAGAFDQNNELAGIVFGYTGWRDGKPLHWSHMLAVKERHRNSGIGVELKLYQRRQLLNQGIREVFWTYDPLVAKNAQINLNVLGVEVLEYVRDMYGPGDDSKLFRGIGTDRFVVIWRIADRRVDDVIERRLRFNPGPFFNTPQAVGRFQDSDPNSLPVSRTNLIDEKLRIEVPSDIHRLMEVSLTAAVEWRTKTREAIQMCLSKRYRFTGFYREPGTDRSFYCLERSAL